MNRHRWLAWLGAILLTIIVLVLFYISTKPPRSTTAFDERADTEETLTSPVITYIDPARGDEDAPVTIVEYTDFMCFACKDIAMSIVRLQEELPGKIKHVIKIVPNDSANDLATPAALAAFCAGEQGKFWQFHDLLFANQAYVSAEYFETLASELGLDIASFANCINEKDTLPLVERGYEEGMEISITALPTLFIGEERYTGAISYNDLERAVRELLLEIQ